ncbi:MAG: CPBP family intramembrane metalloprotease, partial [Collinsella sp.]|nr:CPBP family intramembrane metalloprotease [Collinsella sp.]
LFPEAMAEYSELMEDTSVGVFAIVSALSIAVLAPINEEIVCRGVMFEYAMRAMSPGWNAIDGARYRAVSARAFWIANELQALAFGVLHMNLIQGGYAFALGVLEGWVFWRTGKLRYAMLLHFALNASSYLVEPLYPLLSVVPTGLVIVLAAVMCAAGIREFGRLWSSSDALDAIERPQDVAAVQGILPVEGGVGDRPTPPDGYLG